MSDVVVSTECPTCAAPLDFAQGSNAIRCLHCRSNLLVTGHKQVLSYHVDPGVDAKGAVAQVKTRLGGRLVRLDEPRLYFVPYYWLTGHEFRWLRPPAPPRPRVVAGGPPAQPPPADPFAELLSMFEWAGSMAGNMLSAPAAAPPRPARRAASAPVVPRKSEQPTFQDRYVDRSFLAVDLPELGVPSLGVRASVARLQLFRRSALQPLGRAVAVGMTSDAALCLGMEPSDPAPILHRTVLGRVLSVVYVPFWIVPLGAGGGSRLAIVDAVADTVVTLDAAPSLLPRLDRDTVADPAVAGFRPLVCPNCGWDLPVRPDDVIFFCQACERAWQLRGHDLVGVESAVADLPEVRTRPAVKYLPCWVLETDAGGAGTARFFSPAFRFQRLRFLSDLARRLGARQPTYTPLVGPRPELHGCHYDMEDAILLARFTHVDSAGAGGAGFTVTRATLTWFPFAADSRELVDPFTGLALPSTLLL